MSRSCPYITALLLLASIPAGAQHRRVSDLAISVKSDFMTIGAYRYLYENGCKDFSSHSIQVDFPTLPGTGDSFISSYNYPVFGIGAGWSSSGRLTFAVPDTHFDDMFFIYGSMDRELVRGEKHSFGYDTKLGLCYTDGVYDPVSNPGNWFFSTKVMFLLDAGLHFKWRPLSSYPLLEIEADALFRHCSSARIGYPNSGLNSYGAGVTARHYLSRNAITGSTRGRRETISYKDYQERAGFAWRIAASGGVHACSAEWKAWCESITDPEERRYGFRKWPQACLTAEAVYRYSGRFASGLSADFFYSSTTGMLKEADTILYGEEAVASCRGYSPWSGGFGLVQECYYGPFALYVEAGAYVYRKMGIHADHGRFWQKAGLRYYPSRLQPVFIGACCKAHSFRAEYLELTIGVELR